MAYVVANQWRLPKETFRKFCFKKRFWPAWAIEVAQTRGERITETPTEYILTLDKIAHAERRSHNDAPDYTPS